MRPITVHAVTEADIEQVVPTFPEWPGRPTNRHRERWALQQQGEALYLVAWLGGEPVGHALVKWLEGAARASEHAQREGCAELEDVFVHGAARRRGVGTALLLAAENEARRRGVQALGLSVTVANPHNEAARRLYAVLGYADAGRGEFESGYWYWSDDGTKLWDAEPHRYLVKRLEPAR